MVRLAQPGTFVLKYFFGEARSTTTTIVGSRSQAPSQTRIIDILHVKPARTHTAAPHCGSHCHQLRVVLTLQFLWRQALLHDATEDVDTILTLFVVLLNRPVPVPPPVPVPIL